METFNSIVIQATTALANGASSESNSWIESAHRYSGKDAISEDERGEGATYFITVPVKDPVFQVLTLGNEKLIVQGVKCTGISAQDIAAAEEAMLATNPLYKGKASLNGTWHHKSFDPVTKTFTMELVDSTAHRASHVGAYSHYLDWVAEVIENGDVAKLSDDEALAVLKTLKTEKLEQRVAGRLADKQASILVKRLKKKGYEVTIKSGEVVTTLKGKVVKGKVTAWLVKKAGAKGLPVLFIVLAAGKTYAETGDSGEAAIAAAREAM